MKKYAYLFSLLIFLFIISGCIGEKEYTIENPLNDCNAKKETIDKLIKLYKSDFIYRDVLEFRLVCSNNSSSVDVQYREVQLTTTGFAWVVQTYGGMGWNGWSSLDFFPSSPA